jgi:hypothetical protein
MAKAVAKHITPTPAADPVVELSRQLLVIWDADASSQEDLKGNTLARDDACRQFSDWRTAVETIISFTPARGIEGALVQLTLALDAVADINSALNDNAEIEEAVGPIEMKLNRLIRSAMDVIRNGLRDSMDPAVQAVVDLYGGSHDSTPKWIDRVPGWAEKGSTVRQQQGG